MLALTACRAAMQQEYALVSKRSTRSVLPMTPRCMREREHDERPDRLFYIITSDAGARSLRRGRCDVLPLRQIHVVRRTSSFYWFMRVFIPPGRHCRGGSTVGLLCLPYSLRYELLGLKASQNGSTVTLLHQDDAPCQPRNRFWMFWHLATVWLP